MLAPLIDTGLRRPDHPKELIAQRKKARDQKIFMRFLALSATAWDYYRELEKRRMNPAITYRRSSL